MSGNPGPISVVIFGKGKRDLTHARQMIIADVAVRLRRAQGEKAEFYIHGCENDSAIEDLTRILGLSAVPRGPMNRLAEYAFNTHDGGRVVRPVQAMQRRAT